MEIIDFLHRGCADRRKSEIRFGIFLMGRLKYASNMSSSYRGSARSSCGGCDISGLFYLLCRVCLFELGEDYGGGGDMVGSEMTIQRLR